MKEMYKKYGYYREGQISIVKEGADGAKIIKDMMEKVRNNPPKFIGTYKVLRFKDYDVNLVKDFARNEDYSENLPKSNVLYFELDNDFWCCMRPSGTEPKIKFYMGVVGENLENAEELLKDLADSMKGLME